MAHPRFFTLGLLGVWTIVPAATSTTFDAASAFGARPSVSTMSLSPDGMNVTYLAPTKGQGSIAYTLNLANGIGAQGGFGFLMESHGVCKSVTGRPTTGLSA